MLHAENSCNILSITTADLQPPQLVKFCFELDLLLLEWYQLGQNHCTPIQISYSYHHGWLKLLLKLLSPLAVTWKMVLPLHRHHLLYLLGPNLNWPTSLQNLGFFFFFFWLLLLNKKGGGGNHCDSLLGHDHTCTSARECWIELWLL